VRQEDASTQVGIGLQVTHRGLRLGLRVLRALARQDDDVVVGELAGVGGRPPQRLRVTEVPRTSAEAGVEALDPEAIPYPRVCEQVNSARLYICRDLLVGDAESAHEALERIGGACRDRDPGQVDRGRVWRQVVMAPGEGRIDCIEGLYCAGGDAGELDLASYTLTP
jgi:hypothetical protein